MAEAGFYEVAGPYSSWMLAVGDGAHVYWATCGNPEGAAALVVYGGGIGVVDVADGRHRPSGALSWNGYLYVFHDILLHLGVVQGWSAL